MSAVLRRLSKCRAKRTTSVQWQADYEDGFAGRDFEEFRNTVSVYGMLLGLAKSATEEGVNLCR